MLGKKFNFNKHNWQPISNEVPYQPSELIFEKKNVEIDQYFEDPEIVSATTICFDISDPEGLELAPGHGLIFKVPEEMKGLIVRDVILKHRKAEKFRVGTKEDDPFGAYSRVELHDEQSGQWKGWRDPKGYDPVKYAEWRSSNDPEVENLHDWIETVGTVSADAVRVTSVGPDKILSTSQIHGLEVIFYPNLEGVKFDETIYTPGTSFIDIENNKFMPSYGGGSNTEGVYKNAIALNKRRESSFELCNNPGNGVEVISGAMFIDLEEGKDLVQVEVAAGDTEHLDYISPKTHRYTRLGWAKLSIGIKRLDKEDIEWFVKRANVPPQGIISGAPHLDDAQINNGDKLVVKSDDDTSYIMGWRLAYGDSEK